MSDTTQQALQASKEDIQSIQAAWTGFMDASLRLLDAGDFLDDPTQKLIGMGYAAGAIDHLCSQRQINEVESLAVQMTLVRDYFNLSEAELTTLGEFLVTMRQSASGEQLLSQGRHAIRRWREETDMTAQSGLGELLEEVRRETSRLDRTRG